MRARQFAIFMLLCMILSLSAAAESTAPEASTSESWLAVSINGQSAEDVDLFVRQPDGRLLASGTSLRNWRMLVPAQATSIHEGEPYFSLNSFSGLTYRVDEEQQLLKIDAPAYLFDSVRLDATVDEDTRAQKPPLGGFLNYDVVAGDTDGESTLSGLFEASLFGSAGNAVARYLETKQDGRAQTIRLDSTWTVDRPEAIASFRLGDSVTGASRWWGGAVRFGGIQWASNYATRPGLVTMPLPGVKGEAAVPSTFDLYVNGALRMRNNVPGGPFSVNDIPAITGQGQIRVVVRDMLGREQVITEPYYASPRLLSDGLHDYSFEAGFTRENYGISSDDYARPLLVGTDRWGVTNSVTAEVHGEVLKDQQTLGVAGALLVSNFGVLSASAAASHAGQGSGQLFGLGFERATQRFSFGVTAELASATFTRLGVLPDEFAPRLRSQLYATAALGRFGSVGISRTEQKYHDGHKIQVMSAHGSINIGALGYLSLAIVHTAGEEQDTIAALNFTRALNERTSAGASLTSYADGTDAQVEIQRSLPAGRGMGYRVAGSAGATRATESALILQNDVGTYELEMQQRADSRATRASVSGSLAFMAGHIFPSRRIESSFAVARVGQEPGVRVYRENQLVGRTDQDGYLLLTGLRAYQKNDIRIEQADLPLDVPVDSMQVQAVPWFRSGMLLAFPVERPRGALISILLENGEPLPAGALVQMRGQAEQFPSALHGEVYVIGLAADNYLRAEWDGFSCEFSMPYTETDDPLPRLGPYTCKSTAP